MKYNFLFTFKISSWVRLAVLLCFFCLCFLVFYTVELPIRLGESARFLGADSGTYYECTRLVRDGTSSSLTFIGFSGNLLGPVLIALILKTPFWIMLGNMTLFLIAIQACASMTDLSRTKLALLLAFNATTLASLVTLNKEIFALTSILLFARYVYAERSSLILLGLVLFIGLLARWQQPAIILLFLFLRRKNSLFQRYPLVSVLLLVGVITVAYPIVLHSSSVDLTWATGQAENGGAIVVLNHIQGYFGFPLVLIPKALMSLLNHLITPTYWFNDYPKQDFSDLANQVVINLHTMAMLIVLISAFLKGRLQISKPIPFFIALYVIVLSASPFMQPRYEYPVYVLLCFDLARREPMKNPFKVNISSKSLLPRFGNRNNEVATL